jgi:hypothetical protein
VFKNIEKLLLNEIIIIIQILLHLLSFLFSIATYLHFQNRLIHFDNLKELAEFHLECS